MSFPLVDSNQSAVEFLDIVLRFGFRLGEGTIKALKSTKLFLENSHRRISLNGINNHLMNVLEAESPRTEFEIVKEHLPRIFKAITPVYQIQKSDRGKYGFPLYGDTLRTILKEIHNALFEWNCFEGFYLEETRESERIGKISVFLNESKDLDEKKHDENTDLSSSTIKIDLINAFNITEKFFDVIKNESLSISQTAQVYFGLGESNQTLYLYDSQKNKETTSWKVLSSEHTLKLIPVTLSQDRKDQALLNTSRPTSDAGENESADTTDKDGTQEGPARETMEHLIKAEEFMVLSTALISDLLYYSKKIRDEYLELTPKLIREPSSDQISGKDIVEHWLNFFRLSKEKYRYLESQPDLLYTFLGVMIATVMVVFSFQFLLFISRPSWLEGFFNINQMNDPVSNILFLVFILVSMIILLPAAFYLINAMVSVTARFLGGRGKQAPLNYLSSLIIVPLSLFQFLGLLIFSLGKVGLLFGSVLIFAIMVYACLQYLKITQVVFKLNANKAWISILVPFSILGIFLFSIMMLFVLITS